MCKSSELLPQNKILSGNNPSMEQPDQDPMTPDCKFPPAFSTTEGGGIAPTESLTMSGPTSIIATPVAGMEPSTDLGINPSNTQSRMMMTPCNANAALDNSYFMNAMRPVDAMDSEKPQMPIELRIGGLHNNKNPLGPKKDENFPKKIQILSPNQRVDMIKPAENNNKFEQVKSKSTPVTIKKSESKKNNKKKADAQPSILSNGQRSSLKSTTKAVKKGTAGKAGKKEERVIMSGVSSTKPVPSKKDRDTTVTPKTGKEVTGQDKKNRLLAG